MNSLCGTLQREKLNKSIPINILFTNHDHRQFISMLKKLGHNILNYEDLYFGNRVPNIIICNDKIISYQKIAVISLQYHVPIIIVDHSMLDSIIDQSKVDMINKIPNCYKIAIDTDIFNSWNKIHDQVLDINNDNLQAWQTILLTISKKVFVL